MGYHVNASRGKPKPVIGECCPPRGGDYVDRLGDVLRRSNGADVLREQDPVLRGSENKLATVLGRGEVRPLGAQAERRVGPELRIRRCDCGEPLFILNGENAARATPGVVVVRQVPEAQGNFRAIEKAKAMRLCDQRVRVMDEAPSLDQQSCGDRARQRDT